MDKTVQLMSWLSVNAGKVGKVVDFDAGTDQLYHFDLTAANRDLNADTFSDSVNFPNWIARKLTESNCKYGIGGYLENRTIYARSAHFDTESEPRRLHLGVDIWAADGTAVYSPLNGTVHSFRDNNNFGDYGPTIILEHDLDGLKLYTLYGHLSRESLNRSQVGDPVNANQKIATFGKYSENGQWPPHLHFQLVFDMQGKAGDFPGVCRYSEKIEYMANVPDPQLILKFTAAVNE